MYIFGFISAFFGALTVICTYYIYKELFNDTKFALFPPILLAISPTFFFASTISEVFTLNLFFVSLTILMWLQKRFLLWGLAWALAISSHATSVLLIFPFLMSFVKENRKANKSEICQGIIIMSLVSAIFYAGVLSFYPSFMDFVRDYITISAREYINKNPTVMITNIFKMLTFAGLLISLSAISVGKYIYYRYKQTKQLSFLLA